MATSRRIAGPNAKNRGVLLDAAERLLLSDGYGAVTSRRVAAEAGLKPQLVHYYFATMDELLLAVFHRRAEQGLERQARALASDRPLHDLWATMRDQRGTALLMELYALAGHREELRAEFGRYGDRYRAVLTDALASAMAERPATLSLPSPAATAVLMTGLSQVLVLERTLGISGGHDEALAAITRLLDELEPVT